MFNSFIQVYNPEVGLSAHNSMSFKRKPGAFTDSVKGESMNNPFWPGIYSLSVLVQWFINLFCRSLEFNVTQKDWIDGFDGIHIRDLNYFYLILIK